MTTRRTFSIILALAFLVPLFSSCATGRSNSSSCGYPAEMTVGNSTKKIPTGSCAGIFGSAGTTVHIKVGQVLTVHFTEHDFTAVRSQHPKVLELTAENSTEQRYQAISPGTSEILYSPPIGNCAIEFGHTMATPCVVAEVSVTKSCASKAVGGCISPQNKGAIRSNESPPQISPTLAAFKAQQSPLAILCNSGFFTNTQIQLLVQQFGGIECFRFSGEDQWIVIGDGHSQQSNAPFPGSTNGGPVVATENCASSDWSCLDPSAVHNFANFTVYYPPDPPGDFLGNLYATTYGDLLSINGASYCPAAIFDITNGKWYPKSASEKALETNPGSVKSLPNPAPVGGSKALTQEAPPATVSDC